MGEVKRSKPFPPEFLKYLEEVACSSLKVDWELAYLSTMVLFLTCVSVVTEFKTSRVKERRGLALPVCAQVLGASGADWVDLDTRVTRRLLGNHVLKRDGSWLAYSEEALSAPLSTLRTVIAKMGATSQEVSSTTVASDAKAAQRFATSGHRPLLCIPIARDIRADRPRLPSLDSKEFFKARALSCGLTT
eukprot:55789-Amphidinium_carterae.1